MAMLQPYRRVPCQLGPPGPRQGTSDPLPDRRLPSRLVTAIGRPEGLRSPEVAVGAQWSGFALMAVHHGVYVLALDAVNVADLHRLKRTALDPVADRLGGQLELGGDLLDGKELLVRHESTLNARTRTER